MTHTPALPTETPPPQIKVKNKTGRYTLCHRTKQIKKTHHNGNVKMRRLHACGSSSSKAHSRSIQPPPDIKDIVQLGKHAVHLNTSKTDVKVKMFLYNKMREYENMSDNGVMSVYHKKKLQCFEQQLVNGA